MATDLRGAAESADERRPVSLVERTVQALIDEIVAGAYPVGQTLPPEAVLAENLGVSRLTLREAVSSLRAKSVLRVLRGSGTYVNPTSRWSVIDSQVLAAKAGGDLALPRKLIEARSIIERGVAELAAGRRSDEDLDNMLLQIEAMTAASRRGDVEAFVTADLAFHQVIMEASGNAFLSELFEPIRRILVEARRQTSAYPQIRKNAIEHHRRVFAALRAADPSAAGEAMRQHMAQTERDYGRYVEHGRPNTASKVD